MDFRSSLENIYISPLELCNLNCQNCYTNKTKNVLKNRQILDFVRRYRRVVNLKSILFCGGEVFTQRNFPRLVNKLIDQNIFISIITNGTIDKLSAIKHPQNCQFLVSFDGPENIHDQNRGSGNFAKSVKFVSHALKLGFPVEIMYLVTPQSYEFVDSFNIEGLTNNYITQKTYFYTANHPLSNQKNLKPALTPAQIINLKKNYRSLPAKNFGCFQLSLQSNGQIYGCCESPDTIGKLSDKISVIIKNFTKSLEICNKCELNNFSARSHNATSIGVSTAKINLTSTSCNGCCNPKFLCGYIKELNLLKCTDVVNRFA